MKKKYTFLLTNSLKKVNKVGWSKTIEGEFVKQKWVVNQLLWLFKA